MERQITSTIPAQTLSEGVGAIVHRTIGSPRLNRLDPFLLLDEFTSHGDEEGGGKDGGGFPDHPHRGFETVTYMIDGRMEHADNKGHWGIIGPGAIQWMTAGKGIIHSEMPANEAGEPIRGIQLWVNLPAVDKMTAPRYQEVSAENIPEVALDGGGKARIIAGTFKNVEGPASGIAVDPLYLDIHLTPGSKTVIDLPVDHAGFVYGLEGTFTVGAGSHGAESHGEGAQLVETRMLAVLSSGTKVTLLAGDKGARLLLIAASPLNEPVARHGPFVMNTQEQIQEAMDDFREGRF